MVLLYGVIFADEKNFHEDFNQFLIYETEKPDHKFLGDNNEHMLRVSA